MVEASSESEKRDEIILADWLNRCHCGDALDLMRQLPDNSIDLIVTSPPYNLRRSTGGKKDGTHSKWANSALLVEGYEDHDDDMPYAEYVEWQRNCLNAMMRLLKNDGAIFYNHKWRVQNNLMQDRSEIVEGFPVRQIIIWQRSGGFNFNRNYFLPTYEVIYMIAKPQFLLAKNANKVGDVWSIPQEQNNPHPASFPVRLAQRIIASTTAKTVLDPFIGSGTTAVASKLEGRNWIGLELSETYVALTNERLSMYPHELRTNENGQCALPFTFE